MTSLIEQRLQKVTIHLIMAVLMVLMTSISLMAQTKQNAENAAFNEKCFKCHGQSKYKYQNSESGSEVTKRMYIETIINRGQFAESNHRNFKCTDCHSEDYDTFPHPGRLRMESKYSCIDCHGGDEVTAKYKFEEIEKEFQASVHSTKHSADFNCWMCHNPHTYKINARSEEKIKDVVAYDNAICLNCHADITKYQMLTDKVNPNILKTHAWLPNQALHFKNVRCIECHARTNDSILVAHNIQPKAKAVRRCVECHSTNSILMASLYKYKVKEVRSKAGFYNGVIMNEGYVIGANRNYYLGLLSLIMFGFVLAGIIIHASLRILKRKK
jgi:Zn finger protein HypA/HybF involved in hydrogenase expression